MTKFWTRSKCFIPGKCFVCVCVCMAGISIALLAFHCVPMPSYSVYIQLVPMVVVFKKCELPVSYTNMHRRSNFLQLALMRAGRSYLLDVCYSSRAILVELSWRFSLFMVFTWGDFVIWFALQFSLCGCLVERLWELCAPLPVTQALNPTPSYGQLCVSIPHTL